MKDYEGIIEAAKTSIKAKQLAAQLIPRFFKFFPALSDRAVDAHLDLIEEEELGVSVFAFSTGSTGCHYLIFGIYLTSDHYLYVKCLNELLKMCGNFCFFLLASMNYFNFISGELIKFFLLAQ